MALAEGGEAGGVSGLPVGRGPGEQMGMCLLGTAAGVPREEVLSDRCGGGVVDRAGIGGALATIVAMVLLMLQEEAEERGFIAKVDVFSGAN
jgi:hypothetical protein